MIAPTTWKPRLIDVLVPPGPSLQPAATRHLHRMDGSSPWNPAASKMHSIPSELTPPTNQSSSSQSNHEPPGQPRTIARPSTRCPARSVSNPDCRPVPTRPGPSAHSSSEIVPPQANVGRSCQAPPILIGRGRVSRGLEAGGMGCFLCGLAPSFAGRLIPFRAVAPRFWLDHGQDSETTDFFRERTGPGFGAMARL